MSTAGTLPMSLDITAPAAVLQARAQETAQPDPPGSEVERLTQAMRALRDELAMAIQKRDEALARERRIEDACRRMVRERQEQVERLDQELTQARTDVERMRPVVETARAMVVGPASMSKVHFDALVQIFRAGGR